LIGLADPLPAGAAFDSGSAMCGVEVFSSCRDLKFPDGRGKRKSFGAGSQLAPKNKPRYQDHHEPLCCCSDRFIISKGI
jgi:hypothetical protein